MAMKSEISVSVLDGLNQDLYKAGVPLSLCLHLREQGLSIAGAVWTAKQSKSGFSISFFWEKAFPMGVTANITKKKRKRKKKKGVRHPSSSMDGEKSSLSSGKQESVQIPFIAHPHVEQDAVSCQGSEGSTSEYEESGDEVHMLECDDINVEERDSVVGVSYTKDGEEQSGRDQ